jgi:hypothetical protein
MTAVQLDWSRAEVVGGKLTVGEMTARFRSFAGA